MVLQLSLTSSFHGILPSLSSQSLQFQRNPSYTEDFIWQMKHCSTVHDMVIYILFFYDIVQAQNRSLDEPDLPANYQMEEYIQAKRKASLPKKGAVVKAAKQWPPDEL